MIDIARCAGVAEKSLYRYFNTKQELLMRTTYLVWNEIILTLIEQLGDDFSEKSGLAQIDILLEKFRELYRNCSAYILFAYEYRLILSYSAERLTAHDYADELRPIHDICKSALRKGQEDGSIRETSNPEDLYFAIWGLIRGYISKIVIYDHMYEGKNPWEDRFSLAKHLIVSGLQNG